MSNISLIFKYLDARQELPGYVNLLEKFTNCLKDMLCSFTANLKDYHNEEVWSLDFSTNLSVHDTLIRITKSIR